MEGEYHLKFKVSFWLKMATWEDPDLATSHRHKESTATSGTISSEKKSKNWESNLFPWGKEEGTHIEVGRKGWDTVSP